MYLKAFILKLTFIDTAEYQFFKTIGIFIVNSLFSRKKNYPQLQGV